MNTPDSVRNILDSLRRLVRELHLFSSQAQQKSGLSAAQLFVLEKVAAHQPVSINALAALTFTHQSSVSVVAQKLTERGLLAEHRSAEDARRKDLTLTAAGARTLKQAPASIQNRLITAAHCMSPHDRAALNTLLTQLIERAGLDTTPPELFFEKSRSAEPTNKKTSPQSGCVKNQGFGAIFGCHD